MRTSLFVALCFNALLIGGVVSLSCGSAQCGSSDACCNDVNLGPRCYNPSSYDCVDGSHLCGKGLEACGSTCYNPSQYSCSNGQLTQGSSSPTQPPTKAPSSCGRGLKSCGSACYNPSSYSCGPNGQLFQGGSSPALFCSPFDLNPCDQGLECCAGLCFNANNQVCLNGQLCAKGQSVCGYDECYDPSTQECCNDKVFAKGTSICAQSDADCCSCSCNSDNGVEPESFTTTAQTCNSQFIIDNFGYLPCINENYGGACGENCVESCGPYPTIGNYCFNDTVYGCTGHFICGGGSFSCQVSSNGKCAPAPVVNDAITTTQSLGTPFQQVFPSYKGQVCCWCINSDSAESFVAPTFNDCTTSFAMTNKTYAATACRVWSTASSSNTNCGYPEVVG